MKKFIALFLIVLAFSCAENNSKETDTTTPMDSLQDKTTSPIDQGDTITSLFPGSDTLEKILTLKDKDARVETPMHIRSGDSLFVMLTSEDKKANIRVTQIEFPDSTFDGPFGRDLQYKISQHGKYVIICGPNMMAGDPWSGDFKMKAWVK